MSNKFKLETEAYRSLTELMERADKTRLLFEQAGVPLPEPLQRLIRSNGRVMTGMPTVEAAFKPTIPSGIDGEWIWIDLKDATPGTLALAILKESETPLTVKEIHERIRALENPDVSVGTIANVGTRALENLIIERDENGRWTLLKPDKAAVVRDNLVWGPPEVFQGQELASHRRKAIVHLLKQNPSGLQQAQILAHLRQHDLVRDPIPMSKSLIKADMETMEGSLVRRRGNSRKWEAI